MKFCVSNIQFLYYATQNAEHEEVRTSVSHNIKFIPIHSQLYPAMVLIPLRYEFHTHSYLKGINTIAGYKWSGYEFKAGNST
jgi:hypothetical protein